MQSALSATHFHNDKRDRADDDDSSHDHFDPVLLEEREFLVLFVVGDHGLFRPLGCDSF